MRASSNPLLSVAALAAVVFSACASTNYHFSQLYGNRYFKTPIDTYPVAIVRVDGKDNVFKPALVDPGLRQVSVQGPPGGAGGTGEVKTLALDVAPCTRYYLVAVKQNRLSSDFSVRVDHQEPVSGCTPPHAS